jgi:hypothetical protein
VSCGRPTGTNDTGGTGDREENKQPTQPPPLPARKPNDDRARAIGVVVFIFVLIILTSHGWKEK